MKQNYSNDKLQKSAEIQKASSLLNLIEDVNAQQNAYKIIKEEDNEKMKKHTIISSALAKEVEELEYTHREKDQLLIYKIYFILGLQALLSSLRATLYMSIHQSSIIRAAWRQGFTALIYIPISFLELNNSRSFQISFKGQWTNLLLASFAQAIFAASLSIAVSHTHISYALMFYNSSLLFYCGEKILTKQKCHYLEYFGFGVAIVLLLIIATNHSLTFYSANDTSLYDKIIFGDLAALFGGGVSTLIYAQYYSKITMCCPTFTLFAIIRGLSTVFLIIMTLIFDNEHNFFGFLEPSLFISIFFNALFTGVLMNQLQQYVQLYVDPLTYNSVNFFQPFFGSVLTYISGYEQFPSQWSIVCMILYTLGLLFIQIGRSKSETEDLQLDIELRQFDTIYLDHNPLLSIFHSNKEEPKLPEQMTISIFKSTKKPLQRQQTKHFVDYSMDQ